MGLNIHGHIHFLLFVYHLLTFGITDPWSVKRSVGIHMGILHFNILSIILANSQYYQQHNGLKCIVTDIIIFIIYWTSAFKRSKLNTKCGRSPRFGRPSRSGDTGCWQNSLVAWRLQCLGMPGAHTSHHHELVNGWGTCRPINKPYEITAAMLESNLVISESSQWIHYPAGKLFLNIVIL